MGWRACPERSRRIPDFGTWEPQPLTRHLRGCPTFATPLFLWLGWDRGCPIQAPLGWELTRSPSLVPFFYSLLATPYSLSFRPSSPAVLLPIGYWLLPVFLLPIGYWLFPVFPPPIATTEPRKGLTSRLPSTRISRSRKTAISYLNILAQRQKQPRLLPSSFPCA